MSTEEIYTNLAKNDFPYASKYERGEQDKEHDIEKDVLESENLPRNQRHSVLQFNAHNNVGIAIIEQQKVIPKTGDQKITTRYEYWFYALWFVVGQGLGIGSYGGALQQSLLYQQFPSGFLNWGGQTIALNAMLLDLNGILFGVQVVCLVLLGPYADYGTWRPWILRVSTIVLCVTTLGFTGLKDSSQWNIANFLYVLGNIALNIASSFYMAVFPGLVRDLPKLIESQESVLSGTKSPEEHEQLDMLERSKLYNITNILASSVSLILLGIAIGIAYKIGTATPEQLFSGYRVLIGFFGATNVLFALPWFLVEQKRPGQQLPKDTGFLLAGPKQLWQAIKYIRDFKQAILYLVAWFIFQDVLGTTVIVVGLLQNATIQFNTVELSALSLLLVFGAGAGTLIANWIQQRFKYKVKTMLIIGAFFQLVPVLWGMIGNWTNVIGYHNAWEFWWLNSYYITGGLWGSYSVIMITELVPAPKMYLFMALFNCIGKTSIFIGPLIGSAIINAAGGNSNAAFYFLFPAGVVGFGFLCLLDVDKAKIDNAIFLEREANDLYAGSEVPEYPRV